MQRNRETLLYSAGGIIALFAILVAVNFLISAFNARAQPRMGRRIADHSQPPAEGKRPHQFRLRPLQRFGNGERARFNLQRRPAIGIRITVKRSGIQLTASMVQVRVRVQEGGNPPSPCPPPPPGSY
jgi:hypothetical protein